MTEQVLLLCLIGVCFVLAPLMTNLFLIKDSRVYRSLHVGALIILGIAAVTNIEILVLVWPLFCLAGLAIFLKREFKTLFSFVGFASVIPFVFSLISALWFTCGVLDAKLLGYGPTWSFYAALHGGFLGWFFVGCVATLSRRNNGGNAYLIACYLIFVLFLCTALGINGVPYVKRLGVVGLTALVPFLIGRYLLKLKKPNVISFALASISLAAIALSMTMATVNEFIMTLPSGASGLPIMVVVHGVLNAAIVVPCFFLAIYFERRSNVRTT